MDPIERHVKRRLVRQREKIHEGIEASGCLTRFFQVWPPLNKDAEHESHTVFILSTKASEALQHCGCN